jgi:hypothetical protein
MSSASLVSLLPYIIGGMTEAGKLGLQWFFISQILQGKTPEETRAVMNAEYDEFQLKDTATLVRFGDDQEEESEVPE